MTKLEKVVGLLVTVAKLEIEKAKTLAIATDKIYRDDAKASKETKAVAKALYVREYLKDTQKAVKGAQVEITLKALENQVLNSVKNHKEPAKECAAIIKKIDGGEVVQLNNGCQYKAITPKTSAPKKTVSKNA
jgi:hypothetical protein